LAVRYFAEAAGLMPAVPAAVIDEGFIDGPRQDDV
jgi:hypothetical protein